MKILRNFLVIPVLIYCTQVSGQNTDSLQTKKDTVPAPQAQSTTPKRTFQEKYDIGFGSGFWITPGETYIEIAPIIAYRFPKRLITGVGYRYIYRHDRIFDRDLNSYGPNVFARLNLLKRIYFWTEYEWLTTEYLTENIGGETAYKSTEEVDSWFAGLGYVRSFGRRGRGGISIQVLYNMYYERDDKISPYYFPVTYRVGYFF